VATAPAPVVAIPTPAAPAAVTPASVASHGAPASVATAPRPPSAAQFGEEFLPRKQRSTAAQDEYVLLSNITGVREVGPKIFIISLANGQVWRQEGSQITVFFHAGDHARLEKGVLGDYRMSTAATGVKNWVRVTRIQ
jgi:hypothetical protein